MDSKKSNNLIVWLFDDRLDTFIEQPIEKRKQYLAPEIESVIISLFEQQVDTTEKRKLALSNMRTVFNERWDEFQTYIKQKNDRERAIKVKNTLSKLWLNEQVFFYTPIEDLEEYEKLYQQYTVWVEWLYWQVEDVFNDLAKTLSDRLPAIYFQNTELSSKQKTRKYEESMYMRHTLREKFAYFILPTAQRPYSVHPAYVYDTLCKYMEPLIQTLSTEWHIKTFFSGLIAEIRWNYCLSNYQDEEQSIHKYHLSAEKHRLLDVSMKTDDLYILQVPEQHKVWLAVDYKEQWDRQETECMYDTMIPKNTGSYNDLLASQIKELILETEDDTHICMMITYVGRWSVYGTLFTPENIPQKSMQFVSSFLKAVPYSPSYNPMRYTYKENMIQDWQQWESDDLTVELTEHILDLFLTANSYEIVQ